MGLARDVVVQDFIVSNGKIAQGYFDLSEKIIDSMCESHPGREAVLMRLLEQAESVTVHYLNAHQQVVLGLYSSPESLDASAMARMTPDDNHPAPMLTVVTPVARLAEPDAPLSYEQWLRNEIGSITGFAAATLDLEQGFEQMGLDSLNRVDLYDALTKAFPETRTRSEAFFDLATPAALLALLHSGPELPARDVEACVMEHLAHITGFAAQDIDTLQSYESLGLDSLVRLDFLDLILADWPQLKAHGSALVDTQTPQATIERILQALDGAPTDLVAEPADVAATDGHDSQGKVSASLFEAMAPLVSEEVRTLDIETPFAELGLDGFGRESLCHSLAQHCATSEFAGEALMSRRSPQDAVALLTRMG